MKRVVIAALVIAAGIGLYRFANLESLSDAVLSMSAESILVLFLLLLANELVKGLRWAYFLQSTKLDIRIIDGLTTYLGAQAATAIPGGSVLSARLAQEHGHVRMHQAAAGLVGQGIADIFALAIVASTAILLTEQRPIQLLIPVLAILVASTGVAIIRSTRLARWTFTFLGRWRITRRFLPEEEDFWHHTVTLMRPRVIVTGIAYSLATTCFAAAILITITGALTERGISPGEALYAHSLSTVARMVIPVPGGFGVSDGSLAGLLNFIGIGLTRATFVALGYRSVGLLFRTLFGLLVLIARYPHLLVGPLRVPRERPAALPSPPVAERGRIRAEATGILGDAGRTEIAGTPGSG